MIFKILGISIGGFAGVLLLVALYFIGFTVGGCIIFAVWNWVVVEMVGFGQPITLYWQAFGISIVIWALKNLLK